MVPCTAGGLPACPAGTSGIDGDRGTGGEGGTGSDRGVAGEGGRVATRRRVATVRPAGVVEASGDRGTGGEGGRVATVRPAGVVEARAGGAGRLAGRRGRPRGTSRRQLELIALRLFTEQGFDQTTIEQIAAEAGVSRRTFFRYFDSKAAALWGEFDAEVERIRAALAAVPTGVPMMDAIRQAVVTANIYRAADIPELRARMNLIISVPALQSSAAVRYDAWERAISEFAATRLGQPANSLYPLAIGRATLAACRAAYDRWCARGDADLTGYLAAAIAALSAGFAPAALPPEGQALPPEGQALPHRDPAAGPSPS